MGITGSITAKAYVNPIMKQFTTWGEKELAEVMRRSKFQLSETFALRYHEFTFLLGQYEVGYSVARPMFDKIFDKDANKLVDKFEVICVLAMLSTMTTNEKIGFIFDLFNFNDKGYLTQAETSLLIRTLVTGVYKADPTIGMPSNTVFEVFIADACSFAKDPGNVINPPDPKPTPTPSPTSSPTPTPYTLTITSGSYLSISVWSRHSSKVAISLP